MVLQSKVAELYANQHRFQSKIILYKFRQVARKHEIQEPIAFLFRNNTYVVFLTQPSGNNYNHPEKGARRHLTDNRF